MTTADLVVNLDVMLFCNLHGHSVKYQSEAGHCSKSSSLPAALTFSGPALLPPMQVPSPVPSPWSHHPQAGSS